MLELNRWSLLGCIAALAALVGWASPAAATAIYVYQGNPFTTASAPYDTSDFLSGQLELTAELAPNLTDVDVIRQLHGWRPDVR
jgi:hypothetical protein